MTSADKTVLSWDALSGALSYNVYRLSASKDYELVENVKANSYTLYLSSGSLVYQDFAVKALCDDKTESSVPATASRVQTGP
jgi:CRISPR/Cas system CSM-associated protein Csm4 (group 5 of RAMP superfamily)